MQKSRQYEPDEDIKRIKGEIHMKRLKNYEKLLENCREKMNDASLRRNDLNSELGASTWLTTLRGGLLSKQTAVLGPNSSALRLGTH